MGLADYMTDITRRLGIGNGQREHILQTTHSGRPSYFGSYVPQPAAVHAKAGNYASKRQHRLARSSPSRPPERFSHSE